MSSPLRKEMFRKFDRVIGNIEQAQEHLAWIMNMFSDGKSIEELVEMHSTQTLTKENHRYYAQQTMMIEAMTMLEMMKGGIDQLKEIMRTL